MDKTQIQHLDITQIQANPLQPRGMITPDSLMDLVDSIREHGILEPLIVAHTPAGFQIIAGERRWRGGKLAGLTHVPAIAKRIGKSPSYVSNSIKLLELPDALKDGLISGLISEGHARALSSIDEKGLMIDAYKTILKESGSVRRAEELARRMKSQSGQKVQSASSRPAHIVSDEIDKMVKKLSDTTGENSSVKLVRTQRESRLQIVLK